MIDIPSSSIVVINTAIVIFYFILFFSGLHKGFLLQVIDLIGTLASFFVAWRYCDIGSSFFRIVPTSILPFQETLLAEDIYEFANKIVWFVILFLVCKIIFFFISLLFKGLQKVPFLKEISKALGGIFGIFTATIWIVVICICLKTPIFANGKTIVNDSWLGIVNTVAIEGVNTLGIPGSSDDIVNELYIKAQDLPDEDKEAITAWLEQQGFKENQ